MTQQEQKMKNFLHTKGITFHSLSWIVMKLDSIYKPMGYKTHSEQNKNIFVITTRLTLSMFHLRMP